MRSNRQVVPGPFGPGGNIPRMRQAGASTVIALTIALVAVSSSAPMIAYAAAPGLAIAFWRNALAVAVLAPIAATRRHRELRALAGPRRGTGLICVLAGLALAVHFGTWVPSAKLTSVAMAVALVSTSPVWTALIAVLRGVRVSRATWLGIGIAVLGVALATGADIGVALATGTDIGVVLTTGADVNVSGRIVAGDTLALAGGIAAAVYTSYGERARASTSTTAYTTICYAVCAVSLAIACLLGGVRFAGYDDTTWLAIVAMTIGPQLLGHSLINYALHRVSATTMAVLLLLEVPGAAIIAWALLGQLPAARSLPGLILLVLGVAVVLFGARSVRRAPLTEPA
jgi:drug/metabolite transporter (DMT)-like permease